MFFDKSSAVKALLLQSKYCKLVLLDKFNDVKEGDIFGSPNEDDFKDNAQGILQDGGIGNEGSHHLVRPGGVSQNVYLTSSVTDLSKFIGMEVEVWGETFAGEQAGWLMDVGRVKVLDTTIAAPSTDSATAK